MQQLRRSNVRRTRLALVFSALCISLPAGRAGHAAAVTQQAPVNPVARAMADFKQRVDDYLELRKAVTRKYPAVTETGDPAKIHAREEALGKAIAMARANAKAGDVFGPVAGQLLKIVNEDWNSRSPADRKALLSEIPPGLQLEVNQRYPSSIPLVTAPPKLLARLPMIPEELEYRLVDRRLLLRDRDANLIIDVLVGPTPKRAE
jgi:hypothetical protein